MFFSRLSPFRSMGGKVRRETRRWPRGEQGIAHRATWRPGHPVRFSGRRDPKALRPRIAAGVPFHQRKRLDGSRADDFLLHNYSIPGPGSERKGCPPRSTLGGVMWLGFTQGEGPMRPRQRPRAPRAREPGGTKECWALPEDAQHSSKRGFADGETPLAERQDPARLSTATAVRRRILISKPSERR